MDQKPIKVVLVVPCFNEAENTAVFFEAVQEAFSNQKFCYEILFVDDGSTDGTMAVLKGLYQKHPEYISIISFSRNFGKEAAVLAGLKHAEGNFITVIDADLQQRPQLVIDMVEFLCKHEEYDAVAAYQKTRIEKKAMSRAKKLFYQCMNRACEVDFYPGASDFRTLRSYVVQAVIALPEYFRFSKGIFSWVGFRTYYMPYKAEKRNAGQSKWPLKKLIKYAMEGFISFTTLPLKLATYVGIATSVASVIYMAAVVIRRLFFATDIPGYPTIVVLILLLGGIQLMVLGILGEYLGRIYIQGKNRPIYIEKEYIKSDSDNKESLDIHKR